MVLDRERQSIEHRRFEDFPSLIAPGDLVVLNDTKVLPARLFSDDGRIELLLLEEAGAGVWKCLVRPGRRLRLGGKFPLAGRLGEVIDILPEGERIIRFDTTPDLEKLGRIPLPPYPSAARATPKTRNATRPSIRATPGLWRRRLPASILPTKSLRLSRIFSSRSTSGPAPLNP